MKKLFSENKFNKKGLVEFFDKKGFYIVLVLCVVIVGATAVFVTTRGIGPLSNEDFDGDKIILSEEPEGNTVIDASSKTVAQSSIDTISAGENKTDAEKADTVVDASKEAKETAAQAKPMATPGKTSATPAPKPAETTINFAMPVFGEITFDYAQDNLAYSKTLGDWRTHSGIDLAADRGTQVKAAADGVISEIKNDPRFGISIIIDHQNGLKTVYANLAGDDMVTVNQKVKQGDVIGSVGNTALFESSEAPHLHFEVWKNDKLVDPNAYLPKK